MNARRRTKGDETWNRLLNWTDSQKAAERLAGHILAAEGFASIDPTHPLGGPDGLKDLTCSRDGIRWVGAAYFPNGKKSFNEIRAKFENDAKGAIRNDAQGFVFVTNQYLTRNKREKLIESAPVENVEIYHLERIARILDTPTNYGTRLEFLDVEMTKEEQVAFFGTVTEEICELRNQVNLLPELLSNAKPLSNLAAKMEKVEKAINDVGKRLGAIETADPVKLQEEIDSLRRKLTDVQLFASQLRSALEQKIMQELLESSWESWPGGGFMGSGPREAEARELLAEATNNAYQGVMDWQERFVYYLLLKAGGRVESYDFLEFAFKEFVSTFPNPKPAWETRVLSALGELSLKGFIKAPPDFTPGTEIAIVQPFPYAWQVQSRPKPPQSQPGTKNLPN
jgi:hypothetical protein